MTQFDDAPERRDPSVREAVEKDFGGRLEVDVNHDALTVTLSGDAGAFQELVNFLSSALLNPLPEPERLNALRDARIKALNDNAQAAAQADRLALARFFGAFPYGRPGSGLAGELAKVDRNDVIFLRERFLNPNNATLVVAGNFDTNRAFRTLRQFLGNWRKSDALVPSSFRQPDTPDDRVLLFNQADAASAEVRVVLRGVARNDRDYLPLAMLAAIAQTRWQTALALPPGYLEVRQEARLLPGFVLLSGRVPPEDAAKTLAAARAVLEALAADGPTQAELDRARAALSSQINKQANNVDGLATLWLDGDTYRLTSLPDTRGLNALTTQDLKRTAFRLFRAVPTAAVVLGPADKVRAEIEKTAQVEIFGEKAATPKPTPSPVMLTKPAGVKP
jgi:predicted Zn-dependent peptidase